jgi:hypothetical protein
MKSEPASPPFGGCLLIALAQMSASFAVTELSSVTTSPQICTYDSSHTSEPLTGNFTDRGPPNRGSSSTLSPRWPKGALTLPDAPITPTLAPAGRSSPTALGLELRRVDNLRPLAGVALSFSVGVLPQRARAGSPARPAAPPSSTAPTRSLMEQSTWGPTTYHDSVPDHVRDLSPGEKLLLQKLSSANFRGADAISQQLVKVRATPIDADGSLRLWLGSTRPVEVLRRDPQPRLRI